MSTLEASKRTSEACGSYAGYRRHQRDQTEPCDACRYAAALKQRRNKQRRSTGIDCAAPAPCSPAGYAWHMARGEEPCPACTRWHEAEAREAEAA